MEEGTLLICRKPFFPQVLTIGDVIDSTVMHVNDFPRPKSTLRAGSHCDISISISRHAQTQYDVESLRLLLEISRIKGANYLHRTASAYVVLCLCLCQSVNQA